MRHTYESLRSAVLTAYKDNQNEPRMTIVSACGTGKTRQSISLHEISGSQLTVVFEPTLSLISQTLVEWKNHSTTPFETLIVCSDSSVTDDKDVEVSLNNRDIANWMKTPSDLPKVLFTTYQSSYRLAEIFIEFPETPAFTLGLFDEAHMAAINDHDSLFATALRQDAIKIGQRLFFTATPKEFSEEDATNCMSDETVFGKTIFSYTNKQAVADGLIKDFEIVIATVSDNQIASLIDAKKVVGGELGNVSANSAAVQIAVSKAIKEYELQRIIGFFSTVTGAKQAASDFNILRKDLGVAHMTSASVDGQMPTSEVGEEIEELHRGNRVLHSCKCIGVGTNVPAVDGLLFSDPKSSLIEIIQNIGRGQRKVDALDNAPLIVILPLVVTDKQVIGGFKKLIRILNSIREQDDLVSITKGQARNIAPVTSKGMGVIRFLHCDSNLDDSFIKSIELRVINDRKPKGHWKSKENCIADAALYTNRLDWATNSPGSNQAARLYGWTEECCVHMLNDRKPKGYWTLETCMVDALKYSTQGDWRKNGHSGYEAARTGGHFKECTAHMPEKQPTQTWTIETIKASALPFQTPKDWNAAFPGAYNAAQKHGILAECSAHMDGKVKPDGYWEDLSRCKTEALKHPTRSKWRGGSSASYRTALNNGWMPECTAHMKPANNRVSGHWNSFENCMENALQYTTRTEWCKGTPGAWYASQKHGWLEQCVAHMKPKRRDYSTEEKS